MVKQCWCSVRDCPMHNLNVSLNDLETRTFFSTTEKDYCVRGYLGLFCEARFIDDGTRVEIDSVKDKEL